MNSKQPPLTTQWIRELYPTPELFATPLERMEFAIRLSEQSIEHGGGPFGAVITAPDGRILAAATNNVVQDSDSTSHAEVTAIRAAEKLIGSHTLRASEGLELYTSCAPCIMCFGAIWWSGISRLCWAADAADAEAIGFDEGPVDQTMWETLAAKKNITIHRGFGDVTRARAILRRYGRAGPRY